MGSAFRLGAWHVEPGKRLIRNGDECVRLEPRSMAVLRALVEAGGEPVSRDVLIEVAWSGRVVSDDAVNRQVAKLRRALEDDSSAPRYIETIPKTGFRLLAPVIPEDSEVPAGSADAAAPGGVGLRRWWLLGGAALGAAALVGFAMGRAGSAPAFDLRQVTSAPGLEIHPSPSPSGRAVVYAARAAGRTDYDLFVDGGDGRPPARLTDAPGHDLHPAWSPDGERIAYLRLAAETCEIRLTTLYRRNSLRLTACADAVDGGGFSWSADGAALYFADRERGAPFSLRRLDTTSGRVKEIQRPAPNTIGDTTPRVAADGSIAFLRVRTLGVEDAYLLAPSGQLRRLTFDNGKIHGVAWHDGGIVVASNRRGGLFGLWRVDLHESGIRRLPAPPGADGPGATGTGSTLAFEQWSSQVNLYAAPLSGGEPVPLSASTRWDWWPALSPDGTRLAWTSDRSGAAELWIGEPDGTGARRLTRFEGPYTQAAVWRPDGRSLVVSAPVEGQFDLFEVDAIRGDTRRLTRTPEDELAPVFAPDGRLLFSRTLPSGPALVDEAGQVVAEGVRRAAFGPDGTLWFARPARPGLWRLRGGGIEPMTAGLETVDWQNWWVDEDGVHLVVRPHPDRPRLAHLAPDTGKIIVVRELPDLLYKSGLTRHGDSVVYAREVRREADIYVLRRQS